MRRSSARMSRHRRRRDVRLHGAAHRERPGSPTQVEVRVRTVRVAPLLAQESVEAGVEETTEQRVHDAQGVEVVDAPRGADVAHPHFRLGRARTVDDDDASTGLARQVPR